jgi:bacterioferritin-associated ferredoxin
MYICLCNAITERRIIQAAELGALAEDLASGLGVGLGCGRCTSCAKTLLVETVARLASAPAGCAAAQGNAA